MSKNTVTTSIKSNLPKDFLEVIKEKLLGDKARLEKELAKFAKKGTAEGAESTFPDYGDTEEDNAHEVADYEANLSIESDLAKSLRDVKSTLKKIEANEYGICKYCHKPIEQKRLLARPTSSACVECKKAIIQEV
ncbi:MAG: TraR/DksA C4-type zinc finger protein [Candidatus Magasanikbacteria bacterium]|nr:TraR/DksA C4-type zinc finger protein [Candidatus Magasanikbacteria bacterium]